MRPEGMKENPIDPSASTFDGEDERVYDAFEAGADAMLEGLIEDNLLFFADGTYTLREFTETFAKHFPEHKNRGYLVFIPEE